MKLQTIVITLAALLLCGGALFAEDYGNTASAGVSIKPGDSAPVAGTALYTRRLADKTRAFVALDAVPTNTRPFAVTTNVGVGIAQRVGPAITVWRREITFWIPTSAGVSWSGVHVGWKWDGGGLANIPLKGPTAIQPNVRFVKSSINNHSDYQVIGGALFSWGW